jgi:hypothetical protein
MLPDAGGLHPGSNSTIAFAAARPKTKKNSVEDGASCGLRRVACGPQSLVSKYMYMHMYALLGAHLRGYLQFLYRHLHPHPKPLPAKSTQVPRFQVFELLPSALEALEARRELWTIRPPELSSGIQKCCKPQALPGSGTQLTHLAESRAVSDCRTCQSCPCSRCLHTYMYIDYMYTLFPRRPALRRAAVPPWTFQGHGGLPGTELSSSLARAASS